MTAKGVYRIAERCGLWMPTAQEYCARPPHAKGRCRTAAAIARGFERNIADRRRLRAEYRKRIDKYKIELGCIDCGYRDNAVALDLDHRDPTLKIADVSTLISGGARWEKILAEMDKCDVRCSNCHRIRTHYLGQSAHYGERRRPGPSPSELPGLATRFRSPPR